MVSKANISRKLLPLLRKSWPAQPDSRPRPMVRYHFPLHFIVPRLPSFILGRRRSLSADVQSAFKTIGTLPHITGAEHIPEHGPFLMVMNHFHREDIPSWWMAMAVVQAI